MIPKECKRLAEVDFPIAVVSRHSAREKSIRHGHPSTLHLWWARRPLAACRAMLMALLLPDPVDPHCPAEFKRRARNLLPRVVVGEPGPSDQDLRKALLKFIGDFASWDNSSSPLFLDAARGLVRAAHGEEPPLVVDPFAGGGSIPLEALRVGCDAFASDLNPVACLILKTMLEEIPRHGPRLADELRKAGAEIKAAAEKELAQFYPPDPDGAKPIAYLWARTVICDSCGKEIPLIRSFWLSKKSLRKRALRLRRDGQDFGFEVFVPGSDNDVCSGTIQRGKVTCPLCRNSLSPERVRAQLADLRGGARTAFETLTPHRVGGSRLMAVVVMRTDGGRDFRAPTNSDYAPVAAASECLRRSVLLSAYVPTESIQDKRPSPNARGLSAVTRCGITSFADLYTARQMLTLGTLAKAISECTCPEPAKALLALSLSRCTDRNSTLTRWDVSSENIGSTFSRQALQIVWDFAEVAPFAGGSGSWQGLLEGVAKVVETISYTICNSGQTENEDASRSPLPDGSVAVWFTDPPYYDAIPYADLSDYFFVWLRRAFKGEVLRNRFDNYAGVTPKLRECVWNSAYTVDGKPKDGQFFEKKIASAFSEGRRILAADGISSVVFAHKTTEGWEALLSAMVRAGMVVTGSWPITTEMANRLVAKETASLAASVHLVCRPRPQDAPVGDWSDVLRELPTRVGDWIERLQSEGIRGADLVFACIGPAMEIYSRYRRVEDAEGRTIPLGGDPASFEPHKRGFLAYVWETVGRMALEQVLGTAEAKARNGAAGALEEDSRLTALFLWTLQATDAEGAAVPASETGDDDEEPEDDAPAPKKKRGFTLVYDVTRRFAQPLGIHLDKWEGRIIETEKGVVRLIPVMERGRQLFGDVDVAWVSHRIERDVRANLNYAFAFMQEAAEQRPEIRPRRGRAKAVTSSGAASAEAPAARAVTTLDRLHAAMLLQASGQSNGLRAMLKEEVQRGPDFVRLANALSALYPKDSDEKRLLDAMLLAVPR